MKLPSSTFNSIVTPPYSNGAIIRKDFPGFREDYLAIYSLIRKYNPSRIMEVGTSTGNGTNVICKAMGLRRIGLQPKGKKVLSIDVPPGTDASIIYPDKEDGHPEKAGMYCKYPYQQVFGSSIEYDFSPLYPLDAWFIDGKHDYEYAKGDTEQALKSNPSLIIWHDMQMEEVTRGVVDAMKKRSEYELKLVEGTRLAYAVKKS